MTEEQHAENTPTESSESTESAGATAVAEAPASEPFDDHFAPRDVNTFSDDDTEAGSAIGWMLALYTVLAMSWSTIWTYISVHPSK